MGHHRAVSFVVMLSTIHPREGAEGGSAAESERHATGKVGEGERGRSDRKRGENIRYQHILSFSCCSKASEQQHAQIFMNANLASSLPDLIENSR